MSWQAQQLQNNGNFSYANSLGGAQHFCHNNIRLQNKQQQKSPQQPYIPVPYSQQYTPTTPPQQPWINHRLGFPQQQQISPQQQQISPQHQQISPQHQQISPQHQLISPQLPQQQQQLPLQQLTLQQQLPLQQQQLPLQQQIMYSPCNVVGSYRPRGYTGIPAFAQQQQASKVTWYWDNSGSWVAYDSNVQNQIETAYNYNKRNILEVNLGGVIYCIDFNSNSQYRKSNPKRNRHIKREISNNITYFFNNKNNNYNNNNNSNNNYNNNNNSNNNNSPKSKSNVCWKYYCLKDSAWKSFSYSHSKQLENSRLTTAKPTTLQWYGKQLIVDVANVTANDSKSNIVSIMMVTPHPFWECEISTNKWRAYGYHISKQIEQQYQHDSNSFIIVTINNNNYEINFKTMTQNSKSTSTSRTVRRIEASSDTTTWSIYINNKWEKISKYVSTQLENAKNNNVTFLSVTINKISYNIDLAQLQATDVNNTANVYRLKRVPPPSSPSSLAFSNNFSIPSHWAIHPNNEPFLEVDVHVSSTEYAMVANAFKLTVSNKTISKICRMQNPTKFQQYQQYKFILNNTCSKGANEKILFHGTTKAAVANINMHGFNRSYCKSAGIGKGVYFAVNALYSSNGFAADSTGLQRMYYCKVAVGDYTVGHSSMVDCPVKNAATNTLYNSVTDNMAKPNMFVIFRDNQAYPEYVIYFK